MLLKNKVAVVTGGGSGIGRALSRRFAHEGARAVVVSDVNGAAASAVAKEIGGLALEADVSREGDVQLLVAQAIEKYGAIDLFCSNAGILVGGGEEAPNSEWQRIWDINVMSHVYAARAVVPSMLARGEGYLLQTVSAAGLLSVIGGAPYAVTKHAALAFAEWLSIAYGDRGIRVSALCPQGVRTDMLLNDNSGLGAFLKQTAVDPEQVAEKVVKGLADERFLILPHPVVAEYFRQKAADYDRWLAGMRRLQASVNVPPHGSQAEP
jgi:NAD(P)-dependent dehydrogenase (short-subunit alcohol dehydrogenase family)